MATSKRPRKKYNPFAHAGKDELLLNLHQKFLNSLTSYEKDIIKQEILAIKDETRNCRGF